VTRPPLFLLFSLVSLATLAVLLVSRAAVAAATEPREDDWELGVGGEVAAKSRFLWRGAALSRGPVLQPTGWASALGLTGAVWCNVMLDRESARAPSAIVSSVVREFAWRALRIEPGFVVYDSPASKLMARTAEATLDAGLGLGDLELQTSHALDVGTHPRAYFGTAGATYEPELWRFTFRVTAHFGWGTRELAGEYFHRPRDGLSVAEAQAAARYEVTDLLYVVLHAEGSTVVTPWLRQSGADPTLVSAGATLGFEL
jgi:hypothetical protein